MNSFLVALQFLTSLPIGLRPSVTGRVLAGSVKYYPLIGAIIGLVLIAVHEVLVLLFPQRLVIAVLLVAASVVLTRGLHLDGLADTADAFFSNKSPRQMLGIMKDPHVGAFGTIAIVIVFAVKTALLFSLPESLMNTALLVTSLLSRYSMVVVMSSFPYVREEGTAKIFCQENSRSRMWIATGLATLGAGLFFSVPGLMIEIGVMVSAILWGWYSQRKIGGITGDVIGAGNELHEIIILMAVSVWGRNL